MEKYAYETYEDYLAATEWEPVDGFNNGNDVVWSDEEDDELKDDRTFKEEMRKRNLLRIEWENGKARFEKLRVAAKTETKPSLGKN